MPQHVSIFLKFYSGILFDQAPVHFVNCQRKKDDAGDHKIAEPREQRHIEYAET
jgi:hypothetical protein